ncbi:MAG: hypothetical protein ABIY51_03065 [Ferruginibacter sp.]
METFYKAYSKTVQNKKYYFVKKIAHFPEYKELDDLLIGYGMHVNFNTACSIANVDSKKIRERLLAEAEYVPAVGKLINLYRPAVQSKNMMQILQNSISLLQVKFMSLYSRAAV